MGILFTGSQFAIPNATSKLSLVIRTILDVLGLLSLIMMIVSMVRLLF